MEIQTPVPHQVFFSWEKAHNDRELINLEDELYCAFRGVSLSTNLVFRHNPTTHIDEIVLMISRMKDQKTVKLCEFACNPGQYRTMPFIIEEVRKALKK